MSDILVIPDPHGSHEWERAKKEKFDYAIVLGDLWDCWRNNWPDQGINANNLFSWIREDPLHRKYVCGNHCFSYITCTEKGKLVSGHQLEHASEIRAILLSNIDLIDLAFEKDGWVFSHAGFSKTWVKSMILQLHAMLDKTRVEDKKTEFESVEEWQEYNKSIITPWDESQWSIDFLNKIWHSVTHNFGDENCYPDFDKLLDWYGTFSGSGDEVTQGPLWIRPHSLLQEPYYEKQVVGHTEYAIDGPICVGKENSKIILFDSPKHLIAHFDTSSDIGWINELEFNRRLKKLFKAVDDVKSMQILFEDKIRDELAKKTSQRQSDYLYKMFFEN